MTGSVYKTMNLQLFLLRPCFLTSWLSNFGWALEIFKWSNVIIKNGMKFFNSNRDHALLRFRNCLQCFKDRILKYILMQSYPLTPKFIDLLYVLSNLNPNVSFFCNKIRRDVENRHKYVICISSQIKFLIVNDISVYPFIQSPIMPFRMIFSVKKLLWIPNKV